MLNPARYAAALKGQLPPNARRLVQVGWHDATLAAAYKHTYPANVWQVVVRDAELAAQARRYCDLVHQANPDTAGPAFFAHLDMTDAWIFDQTLFDSANPVALLGRIRQVIQADASLYIVLPNLPVWPHSGASLEHGPDAVRSMLQQAKFRAGHPLLLPTDNAAEAGPLLLKSMPC
ncbi:hypothetical protein H3H37_22100 [Duganella sp. LX20W]|uniref:Class I SAM-dependent methyltransferase n=1 Tax=Rugamonas brunnea TaxID=2758569 RepID=A0A7W2EW81_9BURK|nr:hypothetical protein [Rugamonas brunnea]MBA5639757.1 hypothetical protein [Rugamonas brunnea]